jgi:biotin synthase-related radical SAM superfamily protein
MLTETAVWILYVKALYATTYPGWVFASYKYAPLTKIYNSNMGQKVVTRIESQYPTLFKVSQWLYLTSESFAGNTVGWIKSSSFIDNNKYIGRYAREVCPQRLTRAFIHASVTCKLLFPVYCGVGYYLVAKTFNNDTKKLNGKTI